MISAPFASHIRVFEALADRLMGRGHEVLFVLNEGARHVVVSSAPVRTVRSAGRGGLDAVIRRAARPTGPLGILRTVADGADLTDALCEDAPAILKAWRADMIVGDEMEPATGLVAAALGLPFASVAAALPMDVSPGMPLPFLDWPFDPSPEGLKRNAGGEKIANALLTRQRHGIEAWVQRFGLSPRHALADCLSPTLRIAQIVPGFDFPRPPSAIRHFVGPIRGEPPPVAPLLPFEPDPARPLVFASLGTMQGHRLGFFRKAAEACREVGVQLAVAHCGGLSAREAAALGADFVTDFVPLAAVMRRADLCLTHGGLNTVLDALGAGVPLLCVPIAFDQPGIAARIVHHGVGEKLGRVTLSCGRLAASIERLLGASSTRERAAAIGREIARAGGGDLATDLIEAALNGTRASRPEPRVALA
ncbi:glycosyltransferase [Aureimonas leprariae]|uniref:glycosyltransferase n=1 Tax=Plantimonas leprariae TaxID=2615207 RepID=UPI001AEDD55C|nr:glycosyltransferase [Aureimonas leprariae]